MILVAPRLPWRRWPGFARGALLVLCLWLAGASGTVAQAIAVARQNAQEIVAARYDAPTARYSHAVLGDAIEYGRLVLTFSGGAERGFDLPDALVFEDVAPRLWDVTGDGTPEVVVVESHRDLGARLAIYGPEGRRMATPHIGTRFRWLAPVGTADFDGDGTIEVAYVDRPHLAKTLRLWRMTSYGLREVAQWRGVSNHRIGEDFISGGVRDCGAGPEMIVADATWRRVVAVRFADGSLAAESLALPADAGGFADALACAH